MPAFLKLGLVLLISLFADPVWSNEDQPDQIPPRWASWFSAQGLETSAQPAQAPVYQATVTRTSYTPPIVPANVRDLSLDTNRPRPQGVLASTTWLNGAFMTETEVANDRRESSIPGDTQDDPASRMMRMGLTTSSGPARYGMTYRRAGQAFYNGPDQDLREVWGEWKNGVTTFHSAIGQQWNNVDRNPTQSRLEQNYGRMGLSWNQASWPSLAVTYSQNPQNSALDPTGIAAQKMTNHTLEAALGYSGAASLRPLSTLTIAPTLGYRTEQQDLSGARIDSPSASLAMNYQQSQRLLVSAMGNYSGIRSSDRLIDLETIGGKGVLTVDILQLRGWTRRMSMEGGYNRQTNRMMSSAETQDVSGLLRLVLAPF